MTKRHSSEAVEQIRQMWEDGGLSMQQIGLKMNMTKNVVNGIIERAGMTKRGNPVKKNKRADGSSPQKQKLAPLRGAKITLPPLQSLIEED